MITEEDRMDWQENIERERSRGGKFAVQSFCACMIGIAVVLIIAAIASRLPFVPGW